MATAGYNVQIPFRTKGQTTCIHHKREQLDFYCKECNELACIKCLSTLHHSHPLCGLSEIAHQKKEDITHFIEQTERVDIVQIDQYITDTDTQLQENFSSFDKLSQQLKTQTNKLKQDLDLLTAQTLSLYQQIEDDNTKLLQTYKQDLERYSTQLKQQVQECKKILQRASDIQIYDTADEIQSPLILPPKPTLQTANFTPNDKPQDHLKQAFGNVSTSSEGQGKPLQGQGRSVVLPPGQRPSATEKKSKLKIMTPSTEQRSNESHGKSCPVDTLLPQTKVLEEWECPDVIGCICPTTDGRVWTSDIGGFSLTLFDRKGNIKQTIDYETVISSISLSPSTNTLWICDRDNNITELVSGQLVHRFSTKKEPLCICITASNHVIVGMDKQILKFTRKGKLVLTTLTAENGEALVCEPVCISECHVTLNVAVLDSDSTYHGGKGKPHVVVMDKDFKELFVYGGETPHTYQSTSQSGGEPFYPCGVVYDSVGNLVIGDRNNNRILLISGRGDFLRFIHTDDYLADAVGIDREDVLWAVFRVYNVKLLQYSSV